jgi:hypothetical protein
MWQKKWSYFWKQVGKSRGVFYIGMAVFTAVFLGLVASALSNFAKAQELEKRMEELKTEQVALSVERAKLEADGLFFATDEYRELVLKRQGKKLPDETMIILPERVETVVEAPKDEVRESEKTSAAANRKAWLDFFFVRDTL